MIRNVILSLWETWSTCGDGPYTRVLYAICYFMTVLKAMHFSIVFLSSENCYLKAEQPKI